MASDFEHCLISLKAADWRVEQNEATWEWLRRALRDVGHPVGSWGRTFKSRGHRRSFGFRGPAAPIVEAIRDLWENERPGCALDVRVEYETRVLATTPLFGSSR